MALIEPLKNPYLEYRHNQVWLMSRNRVIKRLHPSERNAVKSLHRHGIIQFEPIAENKKRIIKKGKDEQTRD